MFLPPVLRGLGRVRGFALGVVCTMAIGIGATSAIFSVVYAVLLRPLPYPSPGRLVMVWETMTLDPGLRLDPDVAARLAQRSLVFTRTLPVWQRDNHVFEDIGGYAPRQFSLTATADPERVDGIVATSSFFHVLGVQPAMGRAFTAAEDEPGQDEVALISDALWRRRFGGDPQAIGRRIGIDGVPHLVVGVLPAGFHLVLPNAPRVPAVVTPVPHAFRPDQKWALLQAVARLKPGITLAAARADMAAVARRLAETQPRYRTRGTNVFALAGEVSRDSQQVLLILLAATGCVLLVAAANVANLLLVRAGARHREIAIRTALGAGRVRLVKDAIGESLLLAVVGGGAGLLLAAWLLPVLVTLMPERLFPRMEDIAVGWPVMAFGVGVSLVVGLAAGLAPAWHVHRSDRLAALAPILKASTGAASSGPARGLARRALVTIEIGLAMMVLVAAVLLTSTYIRLTRVDLGVRPEHVLTFELVLPVARYKENESRVAFADTLVARLQAVGGVDAAGITTSLPVQSSFTSSMSGIAVEGQPSSESGGMLLVRMVTPGVFRATGMRLLHGRLLTDDDARSDAVVVNRAMVRRYWPSLPDTSPNPIGQHVRIGKRWSPIVGVVDDVKYDGPQSVVEPEVYVSYPYWPVEHLAVVLRAPGDPSALVPAARDAVKSVDPDLPLTSIRTLEDVLADSVAPPRFRSALFGAFAALALALAVAGLYAVVSQSVSQRAREIGIRIALGAAQARIARMVLGETLVLTLLGLVLGSAASLAANRVLAGLLFGATAADASAYALGACAIAAVALMASYGPARRAARADPAAVLRAE